MKLIIGLLLTLMIVPACARGGLDESFDGGLCTSYIMRFLDGNLGKVAALVVVVISVIVAVRFKKIKRVLAIAVLVVVLGCSALAYSVSTIDKKFGSNCSILD